MQTSKITTGVHRVPPVVAWVINVERGERGWSQTRLEDLRDAEAVIAGMRQRERVEGRRMRVELVRADQRRVVASDQVVRGGRWVDLEPGEGAAS